MIPHYLDIELDRNGRAEKSDAGSLEKSLGVVSTACKAVGISRQTHYNWLKDDDYKTAVEELSEVAVDFAESHLHKLIRDATPPPPFSF